MCSDLLAVTLPSLQAEPGRYKSAAPWLHNSILSSSVKTGPGAVLLSRRHVAEAALLRRLSLAASPPTLAKTG